MHGFLAKLGQVAQVSLQNMMKQLAKLPENKMQFQEPSEIVLTIDRSYAKNVQKREILSEVSQCFNQFLDFQKNLRKSIENFPKIFGKNHIS